MKIEYLIKALERKIKLPIKNFDVLRQAVISSEPKTIVVAAAHDEHSLEAVFNAQKEFGLKYILVGEKDKIIEIGRQLGQDVNIEYIVEADNDMECAKKAVALIKEGKGSVLMKGILETKTLIKEVLDRDTGIRGSGFMSHLAVLEVPDYHKLVYFTDGGLTPHPDFEQKCAITKNVTELLRKLGYEEPKIAALAATESVSEKIEETVHAFKIAEMAKMGEFGKCIVEGPISFDIAVSQESAKIKKYESRISGEVDAFVLPCINSCNALVKGIIYWAKAKMAGCVLGAKVPIVLTSRGASGEEKLLSILLCLSVK